LTTQTEMLLLADADRGVDLGRRLGERGVFVRRFDDAQQALQAMSEEAWPLVVLATARPDLPGLCDAARHLQPDARLVAVCDADAEPEIRDLVGLVLDEYFVHPASERDLATIARWASGNRGEKPGTSGAEAQLSAEEFTRLIRSATSLPALEQYLAERVAELIDGKASWVDVDANADAVQGEPLLELEGRAPLALLAEQDAPIAPEARAFLAAMRICLPAVVESVRRGETLRRLAITDHLTGAYNRRYFYHATDRILREAEAGEARVTLLLFDIDDFKRYNDTFGHATGDRILREVAEMMRKITRAQDIVARIGGDEFAVLFWDDEPPREPDSLPPAGANELANRFREAIDGRPFRALGAHGPGHLTISGGLAAFPTHGRTCQELLRQADHALREVKRSGKNAIRLVGKGGTFVPERGGDGDAAPAGRHEADGEAEVI